MVMNIMGAQPVDEARSTYLERCLSMAQSMGYDLMASISRWLTTVESVRGLGNSGWRTQFVFMTADLSTGVGAGSEFLPILRWGGATGMRHSNRAAPPHPRLICRARAQ